MKMNDLTGRTFGRLKVVYRAPNDESENRVSWHCLCACGGVKVATTKDLVTGCTFTCGCARITHGKSGSLLYKVWASMRERCNNPSAKSYPKYGGRGISVCKRWDDYETFVADMGPRPPRHSIERVDNQGDYCPANCRWATSREQMRNMSRNRWLTADGRTMLMTDWTAELRCSVSLITMRLKNGWSEEEACLTPPGQSRRG